MERRFRTISIMAATALVAMACSKDNLIDKPIEQPENPAIEGRTITLVSELPETKTHMNDAMDNVLWDRLEKGAYCYLDNVFYNDTRAVSDDTRAKLTITLSNVTGTPTEVEGFIGLRNDKEEIKDATNKTTLVAIDLPAVQEITSTTFDHKADALVMTPTALPANQGTEVTKAGKKPGTEGGTAVTGIKYNRLNAITKLAFTGLETYNDEVIDSIEFICSKKEICGTFRYDFKNMTFVEKQGSTEPTPDPEPTPAPTSTTAATTIEGYTAVSTPTFTNKTAGKSITLKYTDGTAISNGALTAWIVLPQGEISTKFDLTIKITTKNHVIVKTATPKNRLKLQNTKLNILSVGMAGATATEITPSIPTTYQLVTNASELNVDGEYYLCSHENLVFCGNMHKNAASESDGIAAEGTAIVIRTDNTVTSMPGNAKAIKLVGSAGSWKLSLVENDPKNGFLSVDPEKQNKLKFMKDKNAKTWDIQIDGDGNCTMTAKDEATKSNYILYSYAGYMQTAETAPAPAPAPANLPKLIMKVPATTQAQ